MVVVPLRYGYPRIGCMAIFGNALAWASMATAACVGICCRTNAAISEATARAEIHEPETMGFAAWIWKLVPLVTIRFQKIFQAVPPPVPTGEKIV
jgi:hypothetical protein